MGTKAWGKSIAMRAPLGLYGAPDDEKLVSDELLLEVSYGSVDLNIVGYVSDFDLNHETLKWPCALGEWTDRDVVYL